jgi:hypothetical protein
MKELIERLLTAEGKKIALDLLSGDKAGEVEYSYPKPFSPEDDDVISHLEYILYDECAAIAYGLKIARKFEVEHKYWEAAYVYELIFEVNLMLGVLKKGIIYYEKRGNFGMAAKFAERLGDLERAEAYNSLHKIQLKLVHKE